MRRFGERRRGRRGVANLGIEADIGSRARSWIVVDARRVLPRRGLRFHHGGQNLVIDLEPFGAVFGGGERFSNDHGDRLAGKARLVGGQGMVRCFERRRAAVAERRLRRMRRPRFVGNGL